ncbi:hypothetical protein ERJ75_001825900 [Trypanosoma vivax]|uniref:Uncharacterized protein n=1 Tax=Trypanosoma vivax (strain Y486) TaxID=1055687 RepID=G0U8Z2_TRYVY|nr:hypothetical protein TRVL_03475 [Trypanosoma vivax]KAH8603505.1 hypothetical protein ERJ75_001825900 [Trypanosoma vivax]CCC54074.1 conserved hypothetical protein [Trypanosoma vivax Y486]
MPLLLENEDDVHPTKYRRLESALPTEPATPTPDNTGNIGKAAPGPSTNKQKGSPGLSIFLRGGNGLEKMEKFAFGSGNGIITLVDGPYTPPTQSPIENKSSVPIPSNLSPVEVEYSQPLTIVKTVSDGFQSPQAMRVQGKVESFGIKNSDGHPTPSPVKRTLFAREGTNSPAAAKSPPNTTASPSKNQLKLTHFFASMACSRK